MTDDLTYPNGLTASWTYGNRGELLEVDNARPVSSSPSMTSNGVEVVSKYVYTYDAAGLRIGCDKSGSAFTTPDTYAYLYNVRSELTNATASVDALYRYAYDFDDIGNRKTSAERGEEMSYFANPLNQYTNIEYSADQPSPVTAEHSGDGTSNLQPVYDADGNQTLVKTATGIWSVTYNGENRPVRWTQGDTVITMSFDRMGRRVTKNDQRFVYDGYLQVENFHCSTSNLQPSTFIWDPTEPVATRPLAWLVLRSLGEGGQHGTSVAYYTHDGNKNVSEVIDSNTDVAAHYEYAPFGALTVSRGVSAAANPFRFSSEYAEDDTATIYYNYRHYEPVMGRWLSRDFVEHEFEPNNLVFFNNLMLGWDVLGERYGNPVTGAGYTYGPSTPYDPGGPYDPNGPYWWSKLPHCPCFILLTDDGCPLISADGEEWTAPKRTRHFGGTWEIRSVPQYRNGPGQQCVYDAKGGLINDGPGAGTPDKVSPNDFWSTVWYILNDGWQHMFSTDFDHLTHPPDWGCDVDGSPCKKNNGFVNPPPKDLCCEK